MQGPGGQGAPSGYPPYPQGSPQGYQQGPPQRYQQGPPQGYPQGSPQGYQTGSVAPGLPEGEHHELPSGMTVDKLPLFDEAGPSAPPSSQMDTIPGYGAVSFSDVPVAPPPSYDDATRGSAPTNRPPLQGVPVISEVEAREALLQHCSQNCCYGTGAAKNMVFTNLESTSAFHYTLETFAESRSTAWAQIPYRGGPLDAPFNGPAPAPWDIVQYAVQKFQNERRLLEVPHTASAKPCHRCMGMGSLRCHHCHGCGRSRCTSCGGSGHTYYGNDRRHCSFCNGSGYSRCITCFGRGFVTCTLCKGARQLKWFIQLTIVWTNHMDDYILERTAMPDELIRKAAGDTAFAEEAQWVFPINHCPEQTVNQASVTLINQSRTKYASERTLLQRQKIRIVPVTEVKCAWKEKPFTFYVYGKEALVFAADYPQKCCCGCTIL